MTNFILHLKPISGSDFPVVKEGFGSLFQYILNEIALISHFETIDKKFNIYYLHPNITNIGHCPDNTNQQEWDKTINDYMLSLIPQKYIFSPDKLRELENQQIGIIELSVNNLFHFFNQLIEDGKSFNVKYVLVKINDLSKLYLDNFLNDLIYSLPSIPPNKVISFHIRNKNKNDSLEEIKNEKREKYYRESPIYNQMTKYYNELIKILMLIFPSYKFHLFSQGEISDFSDLNFPKDTVFHLDEDLISTTNLLISSEIVVLSKSSLSAIVNYYSKGINIIRESFWHTLKPNTIYIKNDDFSPLLKMNKVERKFITLANMGNNHARMGNQIFQLMFMLSVAKQKNLTVKINIHKDDNNVYKQTKILDLLDISDKIEELSENDKKQDMFEYKEHSFLYDPKYIDKIPNDRNINIDNCYFQSEKYFKGIVSIPKIKSELLKFANNVINKVRAISSKIISLHIRRADNLNHGSVTVMITLEFIQNAINYILNKDLNVDTVLVFSDDPKWCRENVHTFTSHKLRFIICDSFTDLQDITLMSLCDHYVLSPSSFGWWGAYFNENKDKIVVYPDRWFNINHPDGPRLIHEEKDVFPDEWIKLPLGK
jgi:hypothetical protein